MQCLAVLLFSHRAARYCCIGQNSEESIKSKKVISRRGGGVRGAGASLRARGTATPEQHPASRLRSPNGAERAQLSVQERDSFHSWIGRL